MLDDYGDFFRTIFTPLVPATLGALARRRPLVQATEQPALLGAVQVQMIGKLIAHRNPSCYTPEAYGVSVDLSGTIILGPRIILAHLLRAGANRFDVRTWRERGGLRRLAADNPAIRFLRRHVVLERRSP